MALRFFEILRKTDGKLLGEFNIDADEDLGNIEDLADHYFVEQEDLAANVDAYREYAKSRVNYVAGNVRLDAIDIGNGQDYVNTLYLWEADQYDAVGGTATDYPLLEAFRVAYSKASLAAASTTIHNARDNQAGKLAQIEAIRLPAKIDLNNATTIPAMRDIAQTAIDDMRALNL